MRLNAKVQALLDAAVADGRHRGLQAAAYKDGELIVDAWAGTMGPGDERPVQVAAEQRVGHRLTTLEEPAPPPPGTPDPVAALPPDHDYFKAMGPVGGLWSPRGLPSFMGERRTAFGHPGRGGSAAWADPDVGLSVAVTVNKLQPTIFGGGIAFDVGGLIREEIAS